MKNTSIRLKPTMRKELRDLKRLTGFSASDVARQALSLGLPVLRVRLAPPPEVKK